MLTDWLLAGVCLWLERRLRTSLPGSPAARRAVAAGFASCAVAAVIGGLRHGIGPWLPEAVNAVLWFFSYAPIALAGSFLLWGVLRAQVRSADARSQYRALVSIKFLLSVVLLFSGGMHWVAASWAADTFIIGCIGIVSVGRWWVRDLGRWLLAASALSIVAGIVQLGWPLGAHGTLHNDVFHLLMVPAVCCYYRAALLFREAPDAPSLR